MIGVVVDLVSWLLILGGSAFAIIGGVGLIRLPDVYARMHGAGLTDTLGAGLILAGLGVQAGFTLVTVKMILIMIFLIFTSPMSTYAVANAAFTRGLQPVLDEKEGGSSKAS